MAESERCLGNKYLGTLPNAGGILYEPGPGSSLGLILLFFGAVPKLTY